MKKIALLFILLLVTSCSVFKPKIPQPEREFRGFWVATVVNIDWPKNGNDAIEKQKKDYLELLDFYQKLNFNAAIVQVRAAGDAFYKSDFAPWSRYFTGKEGITPKTEENLLEWMIAETHKRGMEFHAWLNPYRATFNLDTESLSEKHDYNLNPDWMLKYGKKHYYNPGLPEVQKHLVNIIDEVVAQYDIDAIHFDDYFYPYKIENEVFDDAESFENYGLPNQSLDDWRRSNVDSLVLKIHKNIKKEKPWVQFGVSPFGVWKNKSTDPRGSATQAGQTNYEDLYANPILWMEEGWIDYIIPQAYWSMDLPVASHKVITEWWAENSPNTNLYMGNGPYKIRNNDNKAWHKKRELPNQIKLSRNTAKVQGNAFFSAKSLMQSNDDVLKILKRNYYSNIALPPISPLAPKATPAAPLLISKNDTGNELQLLFDSLEPFRYALVYKKKEKQNTFSLNDMILPLTLVNGKTLSIPPSVLKKHNEIVIQFTDKFGRETEPIFILLKQN
jgi:uncharacterized lipoprotein YddW (UPF0748 family)